MNDQGLLRRQIAEKLLGSSLDTEGYAPCPGEGLHSHKSGRRDFRVVLSGAPTGHCFHDACAGPVQRFNEILRSKIGQAEAGNGERLPSMYGHTAPPPPNLRRAKRPPYDPSALERFSAKCPVEVTSEWLAERSPMALPEAGEAQAGMTLVAFLNALYEPGERVLIFTTQYSQGCYLYTPGDRGYRLGKNPSVQPVESALPNGGPEGIWFLAQPVEGTWKSNHNNKGKDGKPRLGRRHGDCVSAWRYLVLESDEAPEGLWLKALVQLPFPIVAIYTSGGRSVHALVKVDCSSKAEFDTLRDNMVQVLCPLGADAGAMTAVRLSRLPGCLRYGKRNKQGKLEKYPTPHLQRLLWLNPNAKAKAIINSVKH
jgi:hypothetical protein